MMRTTLAILTAGVLLLATSSPAPAQEQSKGSVAEQVQKKAKDPKVQADALQVRANQYVQGGEYAEALPMLKKLAEMVKDDPQRLGDVEEKIRVCERNLAKLAKQAKSTGQGRVTSTATSTATSSAVPTDVVPPALPPGPPTSAEERKPHAPVKDGQTVELTIKELGNFEYDQEKGGNIPADVKRLSGASVRVRGFMIPMDQADNITKFALVPDLFACCFGQPPQIQHMVVANCPTGKAVGYSPDEIVVEGKLNVEEKKDDGYIISIFEISVTSVKAAPR